MADQGARVVIIDDEPQIRKLLMVTLQAHGFHTAHANSGEEGIQLVASSHPDIVILDLGLPDMDGMDVLRRIREWSSVPIIVLSVRDRDDEKISALEGGADDYLTKPFSMGELVARIRVGLRHVAKSNVEPVLQFGPLKIDLANRNVELDGKKVKLTPTEYDLLKALALNAGRVLTHRQLLKQVWGSTYETDAQYLRVYIGHLRKKLERDPTRPEFIITEPGIGYRFAATVT